MASRRFAPFLKPFPEYYPWILLWLTVLNCGFQIAWFWRFQIRNMTIDAISYIGLARHLLEGDFVGSLHGYWSPLFPWVLAAGSGFTPDFTLLGHLITIASFLLCIPLLYLLTFKLWHSHLTASFAILWFSTARGLIADAAGSIIADFLLTAITVAYFILLITCLRRGTKLSWLLLGVAHAAAFLAKAFAMPWLAISTVLAALAGNRKSPKNAGVSLLLALLVPGIVWLSWGEALKVRYHVFTTGYQLRANLAVDLKRKISHYPRGNPEEFGDTSYDKFMVSQWDWSALQSFRLMNPALVAVIFENELRNIPAATKEEVILVSPGGILALAVALVLLTRSRASHSPEAAFAWISVTSLATLVGAYGMLVFDSRYIWPITPILTAIAAYFIVPRAKDEQENLRVKPILRKAGLALLLLSSVFFTFYWGSPFRTRVRDFEISCYQAAALLKATQPDGTTLVSVGEGPYPDHGVGFEVGEYVAYFTGRHLVAMNSALPGAVETHDLVAAVLGKKADAVLVWGPPGEVSRRIVVDELRGSPGALSDQAILDPSKGEVGRIVFFVR
jgi:4-amino-4-deoxy-L-arabinose transferase-like glycosyltransferase